MTYLGFLPIKSHGTEKEQKKTICKKHLCNPCLRKIRKGFRIIKNKSIIANVDKSGGQNVKDIEPLSSAPVCSLVPTSPLYYPNFVIRLFDSTMTSK